MPPVEGRVEPALLTDVGGEIGGRFAVVDFYSDRCHLRAAFTVRGADYKLDGGLQEVEACGGFGLVEVVFHAVVEALDGGVARRR